MLPAFKGVVDVIPQSAIELCLYVNIFPAGAKCETIGHFWPGIAYVNEILHIDHTVVVLVHIDQVTCLGRVTTVYRTRSGCCVSSVDTLCNKSVKLSQWLSRF